MIPWPDTLDGILARAWTDLAAALSAPDSASPLRIRGGH